MHLLLQARQFSAQHVLGLRRQGLCRLQETCILSRRGLQLFQHGDAGLALAVSLNVGAAPLGWCCQKDTQKQGSECQHSLWDAARLWAK